MKPLYSDEEKARLRAEPIAFYDNPLAMFIINNDTDKILSVNNAAINTYGYTQLEFKNLTLKDLENCNEIKDYDKENCKNLSPYLCHCTKNNELLFVEIFSTLSSYKSSAFVIATVNDVTEKVLLEKKERQSRLQLEAIFQGTNDAILLANDQGKYVQANPAAAKMLGYTIEELLQLSVADLLIPVASEDEAEILWNEFKDDGSQSGNIQLRKKNGETIICDYNATADILPDLNLCILTDITERKLAEQKVRISNERFKIASKATNDAIWDWNVLTGELYWSDGHERLFGYKITGRKRRIDDWIKNIHQDDRERVTNSIMKNLSNADVHWQDEYKYLKANGDIAYVYDRGFIIVDTEGKPVRFVGAMQDITRRKTIENEREALLDNVLKNHRDLEQFSYIASHNLRAPLSNLTALLSLIDFQTIPVAAQEILEMFKISTQQLQRTIDDLNQVLQIKNKSNQIVKINIKEIFESVCAGFIDDLRVSHASINTDFSCEEVLFTKAYMQSILTNLLSNSIKYRSEKRSLEISVTAKKTLDGKVMLTFSDNGIGIDLNRYRDRLFGLYQRFHSEAQGTGLGLFIIKTQINSLGGDVHVESEVDKGMSVIIELKD